MKISYDLKMKIISNYKGVNIEQHYNEIDVGDSTTRIPSYREIELSLDLSNDLDLFKECMGWYDGVINMVMI